MRGKHLNGHGAMQHCIATAKHGSHSATANKFLENHVVNLVPY